MSDLTEIDIPKCITWELSTVEDLDFIVFSVDGVEVAGWLCEDEQAAVEDFVTIFNLGVMVGAGYNIEHAINSKTIN